MGEIAAHPEKLELYDDVAVAYDRIGDDPHAIEIIERKRDYMIAHAVRVPKVVPKAIDPSKETITQSSKEPWYRYYANAGTFWAHRWFHEGMRKEHRKEWLDRAQADIDEAIKLNPYAHGLREFAQAEMIRWIRTGKPGQPFDEFVSDSFWNDGSGSDAMAGLIQLGGAWESVDVYYALANNVYRENLGYFVFQRVLELQALGKRSLTGTIYKSFPAPGDAQATQADFTKLRGAAESYRKGLMEYELPLLAQGRHPDTDPNFWAGYREPEFPDYGRKEYIHALLGIDFLLFQGLAAVILLVIAGLVTRAVRRRRLRRA